MAASKKRKGLYLAKGSVPAQLEKEIRDVADAMNTTPDRVIGQLLKDHEGKVATDMLEITRRQLLPKDEAVIDAEYRAEEPEPTEDSDDDEVTP